jgi:tetratricopeptide (TPR) repeat protein
LKAAANILVIILLFFTDLLSSYGQIQKSIDSVQVLIDNAHDDSTKMYYMISLSSLVKKYDKEKAFSIAKKATLLGEQIEQGCCKTKAYVNWAYMHYEVNKLDSALLLYKQTLEMIDSVTCRKELAEAYNEIGIVYREMGELIKSIQYHKKALVICNEIKDTVTLIGVLRIIGIPLRLLGKYDQALEYYYNAMRLAEKINLINEIAYINLNIASVYLTQNSPEKALPCLLQSKKILEKLDYKSELITLYINLAVIYNRFDSIDKAFDCYAIAEKYARETNNNLKICHILSNEGGLYFDQGNYEKAIQTQMAAYKIATENKQYMIIFNAAYSLGQIYQARNQTEKAIRFLKQALDISHETGFLEGVKRTTELLSSIYQQQGRYKEAFLAQKEFIRASDSLFNESKVKEITRMEMQYEFDRIQHDQELVNLKKTQKYESELRQQKNYRNAAILGVVLILLFSLILFYIFRLRHQQKLQNLQNDLFQYMQKSMSQQMNPHFIFNTLTSILYFIDQNERETGIKYVEKFALLMRVALNNSQKATVALSDEIEFLQLFADLEAVRFKKPFELRIDIDDKIDQKLYHIPAFILQPIMENSIKHGLMPMEEPGRILISVRQTDNFLFCVIEDNGVGIAAYEKPKDTEVFKKHKSMATSLLNRRLQLLGLYYNKEFSLRYSPARILSGKYTGTRVELELPLIVPS